MEMLLKQQEFRNKNAINDMRLWYQLEISHLVMVEDQTQRRK